MDVVVGGIDVVVVDRATSGRVVDDEGNVATEELEVGVLGEEITVDAGSPVFESAQPATTNAMVSTQTELRGIVAA